MTRSQARARWGPGLRGVAFGVTMALCAGSVLAQGALPRMMSAEEQAAWPMIGRVNIKGLGSRYMCTGTLIAPDQVLTAAHCLDLPPGRDTADVIFVAGWRQGDWLADRAGARIEMHPERLGRRRPSPFAAATDIAILHLQSPIADIAPLPVAPLPPDFPWPLVDLRAYRSDRPHALSHQTTCQTVILRVGSIQTDCPVVPGSSGGPLLWHGPDGWAIGGVLSITNATHSTAAPVAPWPVGP